jgi:hypothetical protein
MLRTFKRDRLKVSHRIACRGFHSILTSTPYIKKYEFPTSRQPRRAQNRGAKRKSTVTFDDLSTVSPKSAPLGQFPVEGDEFQGLQAETSKLKSTVNLDNVDELPQGLIPLEPLPIEETEPTLPTVLLQARNNMRKFENCVLLTRVGGFYELYFEHADEFGPLLNLKVAQRKTGKKDNPIYVSMVCISIFKTLKTYMSLGRVSIFPTGPISQDPSSRFASLCCNCRRVQE